MSRTRVLNLCTFPSQSAQKKHVNYGGIFYKTNLAAASIYRHKSGMILKYFHFRIRVSIFLAWDVQLAVIVAKTTSAEWQIANLQNFQKRGQPCGVYPNFRTYFTGNGRSIWFSSRNFRNFRLNGSLFGNSTISRFSRTFSRKFPYHLSPFRKFRNFGSNGKRPFRCLHAGCASTGTSVSRPQVSESQAHSVKRPSHGRR